MDAWSRDLPLLAACNSEAWYCSQQLGQSCQRWLSLYRGIPHVRIFWGLPSWSYCVSHVRKIITEHTKKRLCRLPTNRAQAGFFICGDLHYTFTIMSKILVHCVLSQSCPGSLCTTCAQKQSAARFLTHWPIHFDLFWAHFAAFWLMLMPFQAPFWDCFEPLWAYFEPIWAMMIILPIWVALSHFERSSGV